MSQNGFPRSQYVKTSFFQQPQGKCEACEENSACEAELLDPSPVLGLPMWPSSKESACQCRRCRFDRWIGKNPGGGNGNPLQSSCLEDPTDRGAWLLQSRRFQKVGGHWACPLPRHTGRKWKSTIFCNIDRTELKITTDRLLKSKQKQTKPHMHDFSSLEVWKSNICRGRANTSRELLVN